MAKLFKNRTENDIKNKWYSMKRKDERNKTKEFQQPFESMPSLADSTKGTSFIPFVPESLEGHLCNNFDATDKCI